MQKRKLSTVEASRYLSEIGTPFSPGTLEVWRCKGTGPRFAKVARKVFYDPADLDHFAEGLLVETKDTFRRDQ